MFDRLEGQFGKAACLATCMLFAGFFSACFKPDQRPVSVDAAELQGMLRNEFAVLFDARAERQGGSPLPSQAISAEALGPGSATWKTVRAKLKGEMVAVFCCGDAGKEVANRAAAEGIRAGYLVDFDSWKSLGFPIGNALDQ